MSFHATAAHSSRITKPRRKSAVAALGLKRTTSSPSAASSKRRSLPAETTTVFEDDEQLDDTGVVIANLAHDLNFRDVPQYIEYIRNNMFSGMPEKAGMNSTRIAEVLNFRRRLPPFVTVAHIDALSTSSTRNEREISELARAGILRRVTIPNRGVGAAAVGDGIASVREWQALVQAHAELPEELKAKYIAAMNANPTSTSIPGTTFTSPELSALVTFGFLTSASYFPSNTSLFASPGASSLLAVSASGSRHAAGSLDAVGGTYATQHIHGGSGSRPSVAAQYNLSLPNMGAHIKLLVDARNHLLALLNKTKYKEMPLDILRERWDGGVTANDIKAERKKLRGEFAGVLPGRTKKWKTFYGMRFDWVLEECLGAGLVELFETGSVGRAVRAIT
ncbi:hypothetical protein AA0113_g3688 [Alternaria arborescens]|uniref:Serine-threonine protein kinase 19 n=1 Tax=Alternaria arborescens TaxID=156630 RepID=A0A4Q4SH24_9PLEO|nr:hypothetical protein AA0111_g9440 [Alternaria arborescens]RYN40957.1 hypothetical protein AA0112_g2643 [Alternaria arborescens]RYO21883.1 hypothetical protein AA0111_g9440 [Alternaria arborescens]RYO69880.1 hypothetical protein AA0113_g3688 [Alternaria arborescens]